MADKKTYLVLKVDVDTKVGLLDGVRRLADLLAARSLLASFFISMGPDNSGRALKRAIRPGFLAKQLNSGAAGAYGVRTMLGGILIPGPIIGKTAPGLINRLVNEGHEAGLHAWDHVFWHDRVRRLSAERTDREIGRASDLFLAATGFLPATFASPGWQVTGAAFHSLARRGFTHVSCTRGRTPFRPLFGGRALPILELPTTLPSMDEALSVPGVDPGNVGDWLAGRVRPGELNIFTMHAEVEGRGMAPSFGRFLDRLAGDGVEVIRLVDAARLVLEEGPVPAEDAVWGPVEGRAYEVSWQGTCLPSGAPVC